MSKIKKAEFYGFGNEDENLGFSFSLPKISLPKISAPKVTVSAPKVVINTATPLKTVTHAAGDYLTIINPLNVVKNVATKIPVLKDVYRETDIFTGGAISKLTDVTNLPAKFLQEGKISKEDLFLALTTAMQVAAIVASGGSAGAVIAVSSNQLKQGTLGKSALGRDLLTLTTIAGTAYALNAAAEGQIAAQSSDQVSVEAGKEIQKKTVSEVVQGAIKDRAKSEAEVAFEKKTGIPVGIATKIYNVANGDAKIATLPKDIIKKTAEDKLKKAGLSDAMTQAILSNNAEALGVAIKDAPNLAIDKAKRDIEAAKVKAQETLTVAGLQKIAKEKSDKAIAQAKDVDAHKAKLDKMVAGEAKKQADKLFQEALKKLGLLQKDAVDAAFDYEIGSAQAAVRVAAAEEGRYSDMTGPLVLGVTALLGVGAFFLLKE